MQRGDDQIIMKGQGQGQYQDRRLKGVQVQNQAQAQPPQKCPRCDSLNTKFCYYNNYSLSQPRYLCKTCRRYWTQGGTLRNVPVGGGCRKGKRPKQSSHSADKTNSQPPPPQVLPPQQVIFSGIPLITTSSYFNPPGEEQLVCSSSWVNSFGSSQLSQGEFQIQASEIFEMMDHQSGKAAVSSSSPAAWPQSYINNSISNPMAAVGAAIVCTTGNSNSNASGVNPTNNTTAINQWPDYMPGFCPPP